MRDESNKKIITIPFKKEREEEDSETYFNFYKEYLTKILDHIQSQNKKFPKSLKKFLEISEIEQEEGSFSFFILLFIFKKIKKI